MQGGGSGGGGRSAGLGLGLLRVVKFPLFNEFTEVACGWFREWGCDVGGGGVLSSE